MKSLPTLPSRRTPTLLSSLQRRLMIAECRQDEHWLNLAENVPVWPVGEEPEARVHFAGPEAYAYARSQGIPELIEAIVTREASVSASTLIQPKNVAISAGGMHALGIVLRECAARGYRKAIYAIPTFIGVHEALITAGLSICPLPLTTTEADWDLLSAACTEPAIVYLNLPHNPTGRTATVPYLVMLAEFASTHDVMVVYDAVYDSFLFGVDSVPTPIDWAVSSPNVVVINSVSKNFGRPGDRIGWIVAHEDMINFLVPRIEWEIVCVNPRTQLTATTIIRGGNSPLVQAVQKGRETFSQSIQGHPVLDIALPAGGTQLWLDLGVDDIESLAEYALLEHHIILTTSSNYAPGLKGLIRFPTGLPSTQIEQGVQALGRILNEWRQR
jgi:aspartate aminotransferase